MLRCEGWDTLVLKLAARHGNGVTDGENSRIKYTDHISGVCLGDDLTILRHDLLWLGKL